MRIIVCVKQVDRIYVQNGYDPVSGGIVAKGLVRVINPYDEVAVEKALRLKEKAGQGQVGVISLGPPRAKEALRWCLAMGADDAVHIVHGVDESFDPWVTASILTDIIKEEPFDLLLFGKKAIDDEMGQVGIFVSELLDLPVVASATEIEITEMGIVRAQRALERGNREEVVCELPAVFTAEKALCRPRYPTFPGRKSANAKPIKTIDLSSRAPCPTDTAMNIVKLAPPKLRPKKILSPDSGLSAAARINFVMTGGMGRKKGSAVRGDTGQMVSGIINFLEEKKLI